MIEGESGWGGKAFSGVTGTIVWTTGPKSSFGLRGVGGVVSVVGGKNCVGLERSGGTAGERGRGVTRRIGAGAGLEETQAREGGD